MSISICVIWSLDGTTIECVISKCGLFWGFSILSCQKQLYQDDYKMQLSWWLMTKKLYLSATSKSKCHVSAHVACIGIHFLPFFHAQFHAVHRLSSNFSVHAKYISLHLWQLHYRHSTTTEKPKPSHWPADLGSSTSDNPVTLNFSSQGHCIQTTCYALYLHCAFSALTLSVGRASGP